jgi:predicted nucleic acid-binding protein
VSIIVDASVAAKWLLFEPERDQAVAILMRWLKGEVNLLAPEILPLELASALWKRVNRGLLPEKSALPLYEDFIRLRLPLAPIGDLAVVALELALRHRHAVYDCLYVALAADLKWDLVTADQKLFTTFGPTFPNVFLLRNWT